MSWRKQRGDPLLRCCYHPSRWGWRRLVVLSVLLSLAPPAQAYDGGTFSAGDDHTCGVKGDGSVACWVNIAVGETTPPPGPFTQVSAGWGYTCGLKTGGTVACWGDKEVVQRVLLTGTFTQISAADAHTCGVKVDGTVVCRGANLFGQGSAPAGTFTQVSTGTMYSCGVKRDGTVACWGNNKDGRATPRVVPSSPRSTGAPGVRAETGRAEIRGGGTTNPHPSANGCLTLCPPLLTRPPAFLIRHLKK
jgi:hypothetical protein